MAWRIDEHLIHGEIDNRIPGRVTGRLWFLGREDEPVVLDLVGNAWRDVAGHLLRFTNPTPATPDSGALDGFATLQAGVVGDITASRKVKVPDCPMDEVMRLIRAGQKFPWHWGNSLYLEWHSERNGRVVIESASYQLEIDPEAAWAMSEADEADQQQANGRTMVAFMERLADAAPAEDVLDDDDAPTSTAEADEWQDDDDEEDRDHPLVQLCRQLAERILADTRDRHWLSDTDPQEHPLRELLNGVLLAGAKLSGALAWLDDEDDWPPDPLFAGDTLLRLKKARGHLRDALAGADAAAEQNLADATWLARMRADLTKLLAEVETLVTEARSVLGNEDET